ncbi:phenylalanine--tRNA ligase subunit beta [Sphingosinicella ginsenosidimutans]|uniref:Phenylalanine--tRNA ligase beta subunit n=1 Tax=Allosphingosinicella ginsenosidimutans TaxID=1176539 RepID=A0A5C6TSK6_9SPHN|nr:phenylalanine--tRNA ligase subunit beta [Sphingosinicella ginsenosidimutans]TXC63327.1 phenylalanine--tRNA ligase subunit beta [Sphingosinicella ginsenosidimutans]
MKFTLSWLRDHLDTDADLAAIVDRLTAIGLEVESVENPADRLAPFIVAEVLSAAPHPQADKLQVLSVDDGSGAPVQVVCGAPNARAGLKGVFGAPGAYVPGSDITLKVAAIRGVESRGMMCSVRELELGDDHDGIIELPADAPVGANYAAWAGLDDPVIDVSVTPNRQDAMGVHGIARDLAAAGLGTLKPVAVPDIAGTFPCPIEIRTDDPEGCPAFYGRVVRGVGNGASPAWLQRRLKAVGQRPISALVDMTNYIMLSYGRPLHVYDLAKLDGALVARRARDGEEVLALNGKSYRLDPSITVIADDAAVHDIGGIMGGEHSGVSETTTDIVIECAYFTPERIALTGQKLGLASDARSRFERGVDPAFLDAGLALATQMAIDLAGGEPSQIVRAGEPPLRPRSIAYDPARCEKLAGVAVSEDRQQQILQRLGFTVTRDSPWQVAVPSWRRDVDGAADIVEEVIRIEGLDRIPSTPLPRAAGVARPTATPMQKIERKVRRAAAARGLDEAVTWSFIAEDEAALFGGAPWSLANPISEDLKAMRPSLLPGLLGAARRNLARGAPSVRLFEIGRRYCADGERLTLGLVLAGARPRDWRGGGGAFDAFDAKAEAQALLAAAGAPDSLQILGEAPAGVYHPGRSGRFALGPKAVLAEFGALHPRLARAFDLDNAVAAEIFLDAIPARRASGHMRSAYAPPALQGVTRDFAFLVPADTRAGDLLRAVRGADKAAIVDARLFDVFTGQNVPEGQKSLAVEIALQPAEKSFTDEELKAISDRIVAAAAKLGATLRA